MLLIKGDILYPPALTERQGTDWDRNSSAAEETYISDYHIQMTDTSELSNNSGRVKERQNVEIGGGDPKG